MKKYMMMAVILFAASVLLMGCGDDGTEAADTPSIPEDLIKETNSEGKPTELEDQMDLELGEKGYLIFGLEARPLAVTLNRVEKTNDVGMHGDEKGEQLYLIGDFTFENLGESPISVEKPNVAVRSDEEAILNDELGKGDMIGLAGSFLDEEGRFPEDGIINTVSLEPGEKVDQKISLYMRDSSDEYLIFFGLSNRNYGEYMNKAGWYILPNQIADR